MLANCFTLVTCLAYSLTLKRDATLFSFSGVGLYSVRLSFIVCIVSLIGMLVNMFVVSKEHYFMCGFVSVYFSSFIRCSEFLMLRTLNSRVYSFRGFTIIQKFCKLGCHASLQLVLLGWFCDFLLVTYVRSFGA
jgi:hypothetical protein